jgi:ABC-2 type transport system permease protein
VSTLAQTQFQAFQLAFVTMLPSILLSGFMFPFEGMPVVGHLANLSAATLLFIAATLGLGLFVSTLAQTQFQAFQLAFVTMLPSILLSGFMFPFEGMPVAAQWIAQVLPLTHFNVIIRGIMLRGANLPEVWPQVAKLAVFLTVMLAIAVARFKKRLD